MTFYRPAGAPGPTPPPHPRARTGPSLKFWLAAAAITGAIVATAATAAFFHYQMPERIEAVRNWLWNAPLPTDFAGYARLDVPQSFETVLYNEQLEYRHGKDQLSQALRDCNPKLAKCAAIFTSLQQAIEGLRELPDQETQYATLNSFSNIVIKADPDSLNTVALPLNPFEVFKIGKAHTGGNAMFKLALAEQLGLPGAYYAQGVVFKDGHTFPLDNGRGFLTHAYMVAPIGSIEWAFNDNNAPTSIPPNSAFPTSTGPQLSAEGAQLAIDASTLDDTARKINLGNPGVQVQPTIGFDDTHRWSYAPAMSPGVLDIAPPAAARTARHRQIDLSDKLPPHHAISEEQASEVAFILSLAFRIVELRDNAPPPPVPEAAPPPAAPPAVAPQVPMRRRPLLTARPRLPARPQFRQPSGDGTHGWIEANCRAGMTQYCPGNARPN